MATKLELLQDLKSQDARTPAADVAKRVESSVQAVATQLHRFEKAKPPLATVDKEGWAITEAGEEELLKEMEPPPPSMEEQEITPYHSFLSIGRRIGIPADRAILTADMVFEGDSEDLKWVWDVMKNQQRIRGDLAGIWFNNWRVQVKKPIPPDIAHEVFAEDFTKQDEGKVDKRGMDYSLVDGLPVRVGPGVGDYDLTTAKEMAGLLALRHKVNSSTVQSVQPVEQRIPELITALANAMGKGNEGSQETSLALLKELDAAKFDSFKQLVAQFMPGEQRTFAQQLMEFTTTVKELGPMLGPMLKSMLGIPERQDPPLVPSVMNITDKEGNPMTLDVNTFITLKKFEAEEKRADSEQKRKEEMTGFFKDFLGKVGNAANRLGEK